MPVDESCAALVLRAQKGEPEAFEALVRAYLRAAYSVALAVVGRPVDAEDVAQDAFLIAFERIDTCQKPAQFGGWLLQIVRNYGRNWLDRRRLRDVPASDHQPEQEGGALPPESRAYRTMLLRALDTLTPVQREIVLLHDLEGWTHPEISQTLGISVPMSRQHLFNARRRLRSQIDGPSSDGGQ